MRRPLVVLALLIVATAAHAATSNVALNRGATASSQEGSYAPRYAVDGTTSTRWGSAFATQSATDREWLLVDLGGVYDLFALDITWEAAYAERYEVQVSSDAVSFSTVLSPSSAGGTEHVTLPSGVYGRYVRLLMTQKHRVWGNYWGYSLWELGVMGDVHAAAPAPVPPPSTTLLDRPLRLATWNIQHGDRDDDVRDIETQIDLLASLDADVIVLEEMATWDGDYPTLYLQGLTQRTGIAWSGYYQSSTGSACSGPEGNMILTWLPVVSRSAGRLVANPATPCDILSTRVVVRVELNVNGRQVQVFGTHLDQSAANRSAQFVQLHDFVGGFTGEKLLGGDFNTKPEEGTMWSLLGLDDAWTDVVYTGDTGYTHHSMANTPPGKRIDYWRRAGANLHVAEVGIVQTLRSDHNPVILDVVVRR